MVAAPESRLLRYSGHAHLRRRLVLATLSGKTVRIDAIRPDDANPGLRDHEVSFLRLLERLTNGAVIEISYTGTTVLYRPGQVTGGKVVHDCKGARSVGYFLEPLLPLAPLAKQPFNLTLTGITSDNLDVGVDVLRTAVLPVLKRFLGEEGDDLELRLLKRGAAPDGGGQVQFLCPTVRRLPTIHLLQVGRVHRIRGVASSTRVSPANVNRLVAAARGVLNPLVSDVHIYTDARRGDECGKSPGFGIALVAETNEGCVYAGERVAGPGETPEDVGADAARDLLTQCEAGGCVDRFAAPLAVQCMLMGSEDVGRIRLGAVIFDEGFVQLLRDIKAFFGRTMAIKEENTDSESDAAKTVLLSCVGIGHVNVNKAIA